MCFPAAAGPESPFHESGKTGRKPGRFSLSEEQSVSMSFCCHGDARLSPTAFNVKQVNEQAETPETPELVLVTFNLLLSLRRVETL